MVGSGAEAGIWISLVTSDRLRLSGRKTELEPSCLNLLAVPAPQGDIEEGVRYAPASFV